MLNLELGNESESDLLLDTGTAHRCLAELTRHLFVFGKIVPVESARCVGSALILRLGFRAQPSPDCIDVLLIRLMAIRHVLLECLDYFHRCREWKIAVYNVLRFFFLRIAENS